MDLLFVRSLFRPVEFGGNRYPWEVTRRLARRHHVRVVTPRFAGSLPGPTDVEFHHYPVSRRTPFETFFTNALFSRLEAEHQIRRQRPDAVILSSYDVAFGYYAVACRTDIPTAYIYHSSFYSPAVDRVVAKPWPLRLAHDPLQAFLRTVERVTFEGADRLVAVSPFSKTEIEARLGRPDPRIRVVPTGVDTTFFTPGERASARRRVGLPADARVLLTAGRLAPVKRYERAVEVLRILRGEGLPCLLVVAGLGPEEGRLRALVREAGLDGAVRFVGFVDGERLRDLYRAADVLLVTSDFENWSLAMLEVLASGTPVVGTPRGSTPDLLALVDASLVARDTSAAAIAAGVRALLADGDLRTRVAAKGREQVAARFDWERIVATLEGVLRELVPKSA